MDDKDIVIEILTGQRNSLMDQLVMLQLQLTKLNEKVTKDGDKSEQ